METAVGHAQRGRCAARDQAQGPNHVDSFLKSPLERQRQEQFNRGRTGQGFAEGQGLVVFVDRRVVRTNGVYGAIGQRRADRVTIALGAERRHHAAARIEKSDVHLGHVHMVNGDIAGDSQAFGLGRAHQVERARRRQAGHMDPRVRQSRQFKYAQEANGFGLRRNWR